MSVETSFAWRYLKSWVSVAAAGLLIAGIVVAWYATRTDLWWTGYLQSLSTCLVGIALTVWLVNFLSELQNHQAAKDMRLSAENAALSALDLFVHFLPKWLPSVRAPKESHWSSLQSLRVQVDRIHTLCCDIHPGANDPALQALLDSLHLDYIHWTDTLTALEPLIFEGAGESERAQAFTTLTNNTNTFHASATALLGELSRRHPARKTFLGLSSLGT